MEEFEQEEVYKFEKYEILVPLRSNGDKIFNEGKFDVRIWREGDKKIVFLRKKKNDYGLENS